jgi:hypothetical protein
MNEVAVERAGPVSSISMGILQRSVRSRQRSPQR